MTDNSNPETFYVKAQRSFEATGNKQHTDGSLTNGLEKYTSQVGNGIPLLSKPHKYTPVVIPPARKR